MDSTLIHANVDYERPGKQLGHLHVPYSYNLGGWANLMVPVMVLNNGPGRTALVMAGNHGDEYPGQVAILKLMRALEPERIRGRVILIPALNVPASKAATRLSPLDGRNLNRSFPGRADGSVTEMIAHYLTTELFPRADIVIDIHTGGRSVDFYPCAHMHLVADREQRREMVEGTLAWNTDLAFLYTDVAGKGLLPGEAERQGKIVITTEMGGGEPIPARVHRLTQDGLSNVLVHLGILDGAKTTRQGSACRRPDGCSRSTATIIGLLPRAGSTKIWLIWETRCVRERRSGRSTSWNGPTVIRFPFWPPAQESSSPAEPRRWWHRGTALPASLTMWIRPS